MSNILISGIRESERLKMEINPNNLKKFLQFVFAEVKALECELIAHRLLMNQLKQETGLDLDALLADARKSPVIAGQIHEEYEVPLAKSLELVDAMSADQALLRLLQEWKPTGRIN